MKKKTITKENTYTQMTDLINFLHPQVYIVEGILLGDIIDYHYALQNMILNIDVYHYCFVQLIAHCLIK